MKNKNNDIFSSYFLLESFLYLRNHRNGVFSMNLIDKIKNNSEKLSGKQATIGKFILDNLNNISILNMSLSMIARENNVSEATVTRFVYTLGYRNFADFQLAIQEHFQGRYASRTFPIESGNNTTDSICSRVFNLERMLMEEALERIDQDTFEKVVTLISTTKYIFLVACSPNDYLVNYMHTFLGVYKDNIFSITKLDFVTQNIIASSKKSETLALVFSYPRYPISTQKIIEELRAKKITTVGFTDSELSPIAPFCDHLMITPHKYFIVTDPMASVMALIHSLIFAVYKKDVEGGKARLYRYEALNRDLCTFVNSDFNFAEEIR